MGLYMVNILSYRGKPNNTAGTLPVGTLGAICQSFHKGVARSLFNAGRNTIKKVLIVRMLHLAGEPVQYAHVVFTPPGVGGKFSFRALHNGVNILYNLSEIAAVCTHHTFQKCAGHIYRFEYTRYVPTTINSNTPYTNCVATRLFTGTKICKIEHKGLKHPVGKMVSPGTSRQNTQIGEIKKHPVRDAFKCLVCFWFNRWQDLIPARAFALASVSPQYCHNDTTNIQTIPELSRGCDRKKRARKRAKTVQNIASQQRIYWCFRPVYKPL